MRRHQSPTCIVSEHNAEYGEQHGLAQRLNIAADVTDKFFKLIKMKRWLV